MLHTYATSDDYTFDLVGMFSILNSGVPFGAFPMQFPQRVEKSRMAEALISDFTINSLLYSMHKLVDETKITNPNSQTVHGNQLLIFSAFLIFPQKKKKK